MKMQPTGFIIKVSLISLALSILIKSSDAYFLVEPTLAIVLLFVLSPTIILAIALGTRYATHTFK